MLKNVATWDRALRVLGAGLLLAGAGWGTWGGGVRVALGLSGLVLLANALTGHCLLYRLMGMSSCPVRPLSGETGRE